MTGTQSEQQHPTPGTRGKRLILTVVAVALVLIAAIAITVLVITNNNKSDPSTGTPQAPVTSSTTP